MMGRCEKVADPSGFAQLVTNMTETEQMITADLASLTGTSKMISGIFIAFGFFTGYFTDYQKISIDYCLSN
ncbi:hypothetical protein [Nitrosopumilus sp. S4]